MSFDKKKPPVCHRPVLRRSRVPLVCYLCGWVAVLLVCCFSLLQDTRDRFQGTLCETTLTLSDFTSVNAVLEGETLISTNEDPQLIYTVPAGQKLESLSFSVTYDRYPYERCLYYITQPDAPFDQNKRVWAQEAADGSLTFRLPSGVVAVRLDPGSCTDLHATFSHITLNRQRSMLSYFIPSGGGWFWLIAGPGLAAAAFTACADCVAAFDRKRDFSDKPNI